jgi:hypothetical protein
MNEWSNIINKIVWWVQMQQLYEPKFQHRKEVLDFTVKVLDSEKCST